MADSHRAPMHECNSWEPLTPPEPRTRARVLTSTSPSHSGPCSHAASIPSAAALTLAALSASPRPRASTRWAMESALGGTRSRRAQKTASRTASLASLRGGGEDGSVAVAWWRRGRARVLRRWLTGCGSVERRRPRHTRAAPPPPPCARPSRRPPPASAASCAWSPCPRGHSGRRTSPGPSRPRRAARGACPGDAAGGVGPGRVL